METPKQQLRIEHISQVDEALGRQVSTLLDEGTFWDKEQGEKFLANKDNSLFLAFWEGKIAGFLTGYRLQRIDKRKAEVLLYEISVHENFRKRGIGKALIQALKHWAKEVGADEVWVITNKSNTAAVAMYESEGGLIEATDEQMYTYKVSDHIDSTSGE